MNAASFCGLHDDSTHLAEPLASVREAVPVFAFVSRLPWRVEPGDWEAIADIARDAGSAVVLADWNNEAAHRRAAVAGVNEKGRRLALMHAATHCRSDAGGRRVPRTRRQCSP